MAAVLAQFSVCEDRCWGTDRSGTRASAPLVSSVSREIGKMGLAGVGSCVRRRTKELSRNEVWPA